MSNWLQELELDDLERDRANFISSIIIDSLAPTNTLAGNPTAQKRLIDSGGLSLIRGLRNAYKDITENRGMVSQVDKRPFELGKNIATSKGSVVLRTEMMELVRYAPTTDDVYEVPQLTAWPQINKMYINDLLPEKSIVKYRLDNGIQTVVISSRNPSKEQGAWGMDGYVNSYLEAMEAVSKIISSKKINVSAGCSGGQADSVVASRLAAEKSDLLGALTLMVCVLYPKERDIEPGSLVSENGVKLARQHAAEQGIIRAVSILIELLGNSVSQGIPLIWRSGMNRYDRKML